MIDGYSVMTDANVLYEAFRNSIKGSRWKYRCQKFELDIFKNLGELIDELRTKEYVTSPGVEFIQRERGKTRPIVGNDIRDRVVRHALCDDILHPAINNLLIYDNGASLKGKGISFSRDRFDKHLHSYVRTHGSNEGFILFGDYSKYYDNILHQTLLDLFHPYVDDYTLWLIETCLKDSRIDVSYLSDEELFTFAFEKFDSIVYRDSVSPDMRTGEKFLDKSVNIGDQLSQTTGIFYPTRLDNYIKIVKGYKYYGRYMDDFYIIAETAEELRELLVEIEHEAQKLGIFINTKKTYIVKLSAGFKFLQVKYHVTPSGHIEKAINPKTLYREKKRLKKYKKKLDEGYMEYSDIENSYKSWMGNYSKLMSKEQIRSMKELYLQLYRKEPTWKKDYIKSSLQTEKPSMV